MKIESLRADSSLRQPNWDSYWGEAITDAAVNAAAQLVSRLDFVPCSHGGVQIEVHSNGWDIEIEIGPDGQPKGAIIGRAGDDIMQTYVAWPKDQ